MLFPKMKRLLENWSKSVWLLTALGLLLRSDRLAAATYYVSVTGSDTNFGTVLQPWHTIQKAADTMNPGDTVIVTAGIYSERVATGKDGNEGSNITFQAQGAVRVNGFDIGNKYNVVSGFEITGTFTSGCNGSAAIYFRTGTRNNPSGSRALSNNVHDVWCVAGRTTNNYNGISISGSNLVVAGNTVRGCTPVGIVISGVSSVISNNWVEDTPNGIYCFGENHVICDNVFTNINTPGGLGTHPDIFQSWGTCRGIAGGCRNIVFERNYAVDSDAAICQMTDDCSTNSLSDWTIRNNIFVRISGAATVNFPGAKWYNNIFYRCSPNTGSVLIFGYDSTGIRGQAWRGEVKNNAFVECSNPADPNKGWYGVPTNLMGFVADYNYVGGAGGAPKTIIGPRGDPYFTEAHGVNGGNPTFVNPGSDLHLLSGSVLIDAGTTLAGFADDFGDTSRPQGAAWDIGPYEYIPIDDTLYIPTDDTIPPLLLIVSPTDYQTFTTANIVVSGTASDPSGIHSVAVNGRVATLSGTNWSRAFALSLGTNTITVVATDNSPNMNTATQVVHAVLISAPSPQGRGSGQRRF